MPRHTNRASASQNKKALKKELRDINRKLLRFGSDEEDELRGILLSEGVGLQITGNLTLSELREYNDIRTDMIENVGIEGDDINELTFDKIVEFSMYIRATNCTNLVEHEGRMVDPILYESPDINNDRITIEGTDLGPNVYCLDRLTFINSLQIMAKWIPVSDRPMSAMGYRGTPDINTLYFGSIGILNGLSGYIDEESIRNLIRGPVDKGAIIQLVKIKDNERLGNIRGIFGVSMNHGQDPGFPIYKLESDSFSVAERDVDELLTDHYDDMYFVRHHRARTRTRARRRRERTVVGDPWGQLINERIFETVREREEAPREPRLATHTSVFYADPSRYEPVYLAIELGQELVGKFIFVNMRSGNRYFDYPALVTDWDNSSERHTVLYDDGDAFKEKFGPTMRWYYDNERNTALEAIMRR